MNEKYLDKIYSDLVNSDKSFTASFDDFKTAMGNQQFRGKVYDSIRAKDPNAKATNEQWDALLGFQTQFDKVATEATNKAVSGLRNEKYTSLSDDEIYEKWNSMLSKGEQNKTANIEKLKKENEQFAKQKPFLHAVSMAGMQSGPAGDRMPTPTEALEEKHASTFLDPSDLEEFKALDKERGVRIYESGNKDVKTSTIAASNEVKDIRDRANRDNKKLSARERIDLNMAERINDMSQELIEAPSKFGEESGVANWGKGLSDTLFDRDIISVVGMVRDWEVSNVVKKLNDGESLTDAENAMIMAVANFDEVQASRSSDLSVGYQIGQGTAQCVPLIVDMMVTKGLGAAGKRALIKSLDKLVKAGKMTQKSVDRFARILNGAKGVTYTVGKGDDATKVTVGALEEGAKKTFGQYAGDAARELVETGIQTYAMPSSQRQMIQAKTDLRRESDSNDISFKDRARIFGDAYTQTFTERAGGKAIDWALGKVFGMTNVLQKFGYDRGILKLLNDAVQNPISEVGEEYLGAIINLVRSADLFDIYSEQSNEDLRDEAMSMFTSEGFWQTIGTTLPMSLFGGASNYGAIKAETNRYNKSYLELSQYLQKSGIEKSQAENILRQVESAKDNAEFKERMSILKTYLTNYIIENNPDTEVAKGKLEGMKTLLDTYSNNRDSYEEAIGGLKYALSSMSKEAKEKVAEDFKKLVDNANRSITATPQKEGKDITPADKQIDGWAKRKYTVTIDGKKENVTIQGELFFNEDGSINSSRTDLSRVHIQNASGKNIRTTVKADKKKEVFNKYLDAINDELRKQKAQKDAKAIAQQKAEEARKAELARIKAEEKAKLDAGNAKLEAQKQAIVQQEADRQNIIASFPKDKNGEVDIDKMSPEQFFVYESDTDTPEAAMNTVGDVLNDLYKQLEENANETNREKRARNAAKIKNRIRQYEAVVVKYAGQEALDTINAARAQALQLNTPPAQEAPTTPPVAAPVQEEPAVQTQNETPAEPVAPEQDVPQDDVPAEPDTTPLPPAEPVVEDGEVNEEEKEPMNLLDGQYAIVGSNSTRGKEQIVKVTQNEDGTETWTSIDDNKTVSQKAYKKQQFPEQDNMRVLGIKEGNEITPVIVLSGLADLSQAKGELKVVPVNTKDGKVHEAHVSLLYKQDADGGWSLLKGVGSRVLSPAEAAKYNSLDALLDFPIIPNVTVGNFTLRDMLEYPTLAKLKSRLEQLGIEYDKQTINTNLETALARWRELVRENNLNEEFKNNLDKLSPTTLATYKLYRAGVEPFTAGVPIADTMRTRSNINLYVQLDSIGMLPNNISNPLAQLAVLAEVASDLGIIQKKANGSYHDAINGILVKTKKEVDANTEEFTKPKEAVEEKDTKDKQPEQPKTETPNQQTPKAEVKEETPAPAKRKTNIDNLRDAFVEAYARTQNQAYNAVQKTMAKTAFKGMIDKMSEEDAVALYLNLAMESGNSQGKMQEDMVNAAKALLDSKHGAAINAITGGAQQETNPTPVETTEEATEETEQTAEDGIDYEALVAERNELQETIYDMEDDEAANANARINEINDILRNRAEFMVGDVTESSASQEAHDVAMAAVMKVLGDNVDIEVITEADELVDEMLEEEGVERSVVTDEELLDELNNGKTIKVYRAMQLVDGRLYPPMSGLVKEEETGKKKWRTPIELGVWEQSEERPDLAIPVIDKKTGKQAVDENGNLKWKFKLNKTENSKGDVPAAYNPYIHTSTTPLNDQFSSAQSRPELVTVEVEVPESELTSGYKAEKAKDSVGLVEWKAGVVQAKLSGTRTVILSRYDKPIRIVPESEVADVIVDMIGGKDVTFPSNVVTPQLRAELEARGVKFIETDNSGIPVAEMFKAGSVVYGWAKDGKIYLTKAGFNLNTPVHEYTHLWAKAMQKHNPKAWKSIVEQLKKAEALWNEVVNDPNYENIKNDEDAIASEVLSRYSGMNGAAKLEAEAERVVTEYKGMEKGLKVKALINRVKEALEKFWSWVGKNLFEIESFESVESIADRVLYDMLNNTQLNLDNSKKSSTFAQNNGNYERNDERTMDGEVPSGSRRGESRTDSSNGEGRRLPVRDVPRANGGYDANVAQSVAEQSRLLSEMLTERGIKHTSQQVKLATPQEFYDAIVEAKQLNTHGWMVDAYGAEDYAGFTCLLTEDGKSGIAIKPNGDIISVFSSVKRDNRLQMLMPMAIMQGGRKLDCYYLQGENGNIYGLPKLYSTFGFKIAATTNFVEEYVPQDEYTRWKEEHNGSIQGVAAMYISNEVANDLINSYSISATPNTNAQNFPSADTGYGEALAERDKLMILENARANGTIGTINGKKSNLPDELWAVVRTDAFKAWFGDWQNDPVNASKVLDENSEPLVVYHGSKMAGFDEFQQLDDSVNGFFTTDNKAGANTYATNREERRNNVMADEAQLNAEPHHGIYSLFANIKNPAVYDFAGKMYNEYGEPLGYYVEMSGEEWDNKPVPKFATEEEALAFARENGEPDSAVKTTYLSTDDLVEMAKAAGHDGVIFKNVLDGAEHNEEQPVMNDYIAFSPNQLKSATQNIGTFNPEDNRIEFMIGPAAASETEEKIKKASEDVESAFVTADVPLPDKTNALAKLATAVCDSGEAFRQFMKALRKFRKENHLGKLPEGRDIRQIYDNQRVVLKNKIDELLNLYETPLEETLEKLIKVVENSSMYRKYQEDKVVYTIEEEDADGKITTKTWTDYVEITPREFIERYLIACDSVERLNNGIPPRGLREFYSRMGVNVYDFQMEFEAAFASDGEGEALVKELWQRINAYTNYTLEDSYECGMLTEEEYNKRKSRKFYVPERDYQAEKELEQTEIKPQKHYRSNKLASSKQAKGGDSLAANIIENMIHIGNIDLSKNNKNRVKLAMFNLLKENEDFRRSIGLPKPEEVWYDSDGKRVSNKPSKTLIERIKWLESQIAEYDSLIAIEESQAVPDTVEIAQLEKEMQDLIDERNGIPYMLEYDARDKFFGENNPHMVGVYVDGVLCSMQFPNMGLIATALNDTWADSLAVRDWIKKGTGYLGSIITTYEPTFFTVNTVTDSMAILTKGYVELGLEYSARFIATTKDLGKHMSLITAYMTGKDYRSMENGDLFRDFLMNGGNTGYATIRNMETILEELQVLDNKSNHIKDTKKWLKKTLSFTNESAELLLRFAAYKAAIECGYGVEKATWAANNLSANFNRTGKKFNDTNFGWRALGGAMEWFKSLSMFTNPAIQGAMSYLRMFGDSGELSTKERVAKYFRLFNAAMFMPALCGFLNAMMFDDDEQEEWAVSEYDRANYLVLGKLGKWAVPHMLRPFYNIGVNIAMGMQGRRTGGDIADSIITSFLTHLTPLPPVLTETASKGVHSAFGNADFTFFDGIESLVSPQGINTLKELADGENFLGYKVRYEGSTAQYTKNPNAGAFEKIIAEQFYIWGGGIEGSDSKITNNGNTIGRFLDVSPNEMKSLMQLLLPKLVIDVANITAGSISEEHDVRLKDIPVVNRFVSDRTKEAYRAGIYSEANKITKANDMIVKAAKGDIERLKIDLDKASSEEERVRIQGEIDFYEGIHKQAKGDVFATTIKKNLEKYKRIRMASLHKKYHHDEKSFKELYPDLKYDVIEDAERMFTFNMFQLVCMYNGTGKVNDNLPNWMKDVFRMKPSTQEVNEMWEHYQKLQEENNERLGLIEQ